MFEVNEAVVAETFIRPSRLRIKAVQLAYAGNEKNAFLFAIGPVARAPMEKTARRRWRTAQVTLRIEQSLFLAGRRIQRRDLSMRRHRVNFPADH